MTMMEILQPISQCLQGFRLSGRADCVGARWRLFTLEKKRSRRRSRDRRRSGVYAAAEAELAVGTSEIVFRTCEAIW
jgi:hypothetical protein